MGLLSDPSISTQNKLVDNLAKHVRKVCCGLYIIGVVWLGCLALPEFNHGTYLSENALSPGLVYPEIRLDANRLAIQLLEELQRERKEHKSTTPHAWIAAKLNEFGLETHTHNYTLRYPFGGGKEYHGKNIYGILRAPRIASTEGIVFTAPYRAPSSVHPDISPSVPLLLAFADFARRKNYWAKDLIFLITEQEQLGMQAWLEAYHDGDRVLNVSKAYLLPGNLPARAGSLQAALNIEVQDLEIDYVDVKIEGLNGKLPNLDMFNLVQRIMAREGITSGYKQTARKKRRSNPSLFEKNLRQMLAMLATQSSGVPNGNHGLFHRYRIDALTIAAAKRQTHATLKGNAGSAAVPLLKAIEGIARSLNNLLERFHQSFFFYVIVNNDRYISIGDYMPALVALVACAFFKAYLTWSTLDSEVQQAAAAAVKPAETQTGSGSGSGSGVETETDSDAELEEGLPYGSVLVYLTAVLLIGYLGNVLPLQQYFLEIPMGAAPLTTSVLSFLTLIGFILPFVVVLPAGGLELLHVGFLLIFGCSLIIIGLLNFALGFFVAVITVPVVIALDTSEQNCSGSMRNLTRFITLLLNPMVVVYAIVLAMSFYQYPELKLDKLLLRAATAAMDASAYGLIDNVIYGNWLYFVVSTVFLPLWILCWTLSLSKRRDIADYSDYEEPQPRKPQPEPQAKFKTN
ncbi:glycosylphosphatidylinositol anchor attachment 1 protein [Drosophila subobscura]|uniref:glycosylphosphatidylinositol anchor attachment 1 protein n=1 Tax=Drosophila subobscura TaxID=7241 RepID=UPI00155A1323|nr:glycosylphosphatidylinositol anchor attachment 1 protein [Drosophila subobscura]XP_034671908.1 glycosylphosphatidylinositol anchor attachment 1 protein [Drosophila subobscura]